MSTFISSDLKLPGQIKKYQGKVRDVYYLENNIIVVVATDRISAFDTIMPKVSVQRSSFKSTFISNA
jgi:phosphoribosylaminoimidazole-succinocarboxamide synthase